MPEGAPSEERALGGDADATRKPHRTGSRQLQQHERVGFAHRLEMGKTQLCASGCRPPIERRLAGGFRHAQQAPWAQERGCTLGGDAGGGESPGNRSVEGPAARGIPTCLFGTFGEHVDSSSQIQVDDRVLEELASRRSPLQEREPHLGEDGGEDQPGEAAAAPEVDDARGGADPLTEQEREAQRMPEMGLERR